jgi:hypothetical protein
VYKRVYPYSINFLLSNAPVLTGNELWRDILDLQREFIDQEMQMGEKV